MSRGSVHFTTAKIIEQDRWEASICKPSAGEDAPWEYCLLVGFPRLDEHLPARPEVEQR
jgi:hypothetical protein